MLEKPPSAAAPNACTTRNVRRDGVEADEGQHQHAGQRGEGAADDPGDPPDPPGSRLHRDQVGVVDDGAHREPGPGEAEQHVEQDGRGHDPTSVTVSWA